MWFKFVKLFFVVNTSIQAPTSLIVSNVPSESDYTITKDMVKAVKYNDFNDWASVPWNSAYFDVGQPDLKLVSANIHKTAVTPYSIQFHSDVVGNFDRWINDLYTDYTFTEQDLEQLSFILFNHNYIQSGKFNELVFWNNNVSNNLSFKLTFEITKPLSFYIQGFMFYLSAQNFSYFSSVYTFSFLDYEGNIRYNFKGVLNDKDSVYNLGKYNFVTMPVRVPNLKHLTINFDLASLTSGNGLYVKFGQMNIFSAQDINPVPPISPFNPEYERVSWYDVFGQLRNVFRWLLYGVVGKVLPVEPLRQFLFTTDSLLRHIFSDTISTALNVDIVSGIENIIPLWLFVRAISLIVG
ncbi:hypothetical protein [Spiroplasma endosymbiont of Lasioglossum malachurum]|uniref:hypothetical protein n=1 Tax=Spiroplasma endosymbiont of Lasioglossum malachurum TaxID=3066319 RepID=UPI0030D57105